MPLVAKRFRQKATIPGLMFNSLAVSIDSAAKLLLDQQFWYDAKLFVKDIDGEAGLTGPEKKAKVKADLIVVFGEIGNVLLNFAIELGVLWLRPNGIAVKKPNNINEIGGFLDERKSVKFLSLRIGEAI